MAEILYSHGFLFMPDINNKPWTDYFYNTSILNTRQNRGIASVAEYFYNGLKETLDKMQLDIPGLENLSRHQEVCISLSKIAYGRWKEPRLQYAYTDMLGHGVPCMVFMPGHYYELNGNETWKESIDKFVKIIQDTVNASWVIRLVGDCYSTTNITKVVKEVFYLRYGIRLDSEEYRNYKHPKELWFPAAFLAEPLRGAPPHFVFYKYMESRKIWSYFHFNDRKQDNSEYNVNYFVVHDDALSTAAISKSSLWGTRTGTGIHAYIFNDGEVITKIPYTTKSLATRTESLGSPGSYDGRANGACVHIALLCKDRLPSDEQYKSLAKLYYCIYRANSDKKLVIVPYDEFDRGLYDGPETLKGFDFAKLYALLKNSYGIDIRPGIDGIDPERFKMYPHNDRHMIHRFPPELAGTRDTPLSERYTKEGTYEGILADGQGGIWVENGHLKNPDNPSENMTIKDFKEIASTFFAEMSWLNPWVWEETAAMYCVIKNLKKQKERQGKPNKFIDIIKEVAYGYGEIEIRAQMKFDYTEPYSENNRYANAIRGVIMANLYDQDYSNEATQWDGVEQANIPKNNPDIISANKTTYKVNVMGWDISDEHYNSWKQALISNSFRFNAPQKKYAVANAEGMFNKDKIRLKSSAQYGLSIFWKEVSIDKPK